MDGEKKSVRHLMGKRVVTKNGKIFGEVANIVFEVKTGELLQLALKNTTSYCEGLDLERTKSNEVLIPYGAVVALSDYVVVAEEDII